MDARRGLVPGIGPLAFAASEAAFNDRSTWVRDLQTYLRANFTLIQQALGPRVATLEGTYLAWIDVGDLELDDAESYFAEHGLGISPGAQFGEPRFIRLNFGCPRTTLREGIRRLQAALTG
jgi:cystathionine beta-lyase